jgi:alkylated DNA repair dioxygenase AlkB
MEPRRRKSVNHPSGPPDGFSYAAAFLSGAEHASLLSHLRALRLEPVVMRGVASLRRAAHFGWDYNYDGWTISPTTPFPPFLTDLVVRAAAFAGAPADAFEAALVNFYPSGAGIGWHRDAPMFGSPVIGVSVGAGCPMKFRRKTQSGYDVFQQWLEPGSIYAITGEARSVWQHGIAAAPEDRYSVTFRTLVPRPTQVH